MPKLVALRPAAWRQSRPGRPPLALVDSMGSGPPPCDDVDFAEIAELHRPLLHRVALRLCGDPETAKDLVQETLLRALRSFDQFQSGSHEGAWLVTILTHLYFDQLKHDKVVAKAEPELAIPEAVECELTIAEIADTELYAAVQALEPELRDVVELCYLREMRYRDAGEMLNLPTSTIGTRLMRARARLRALLTSARDDDTTL